MAGTPKWNACRDLLDMLGEEHILEQIAEGVTLAQVARACGPAVSKGMLIRWLYADPDRLQRYREARQALADTLAEEAKDISDNVPADRDEIAKAREQINTRKWLASVLDYRFAPGPKAEPTRIEHHQHLHIGQLHLDALRAKGGPGALRLAPPEIAETVVEAEIEEDDNEQA